MTTYEVAIDNARIQVHCHDEAPPVTPEAYSVDLPAWYCNGNGAVPFTDVARFTRLDDSGDYSVGDSGRLGVGYFAESDHGAIVSGTWIYMPETPDGYTLVRATYVVRAYRIANDGTYSGSPFANYIPGTGMTSPYLNAESSATVENYVIDPIPVGAFGEVEWSGNEILSRLTGPPGSQFPCTRLWHENAVVESAGNTIHVSYYAVRLYYEPI